MIKRTSNYLFFLDRFQNLDYAPLITVDVYPFENFTVFPPSHFPNNLIVVLITGNKKYRMRIIDS